MLDSRQCFVMRWLDPVHCVALLDDRMRRSMRARALRVPKSGAAAENLLAACNTLAKKEIAAGRPVAATLKNVYGC